MWHTFCVVLASSFFLWKSGIFVISENIGIDCILMHKFLVFQLFFESLEVILVKVVEFLITSAKLATLDLLNILR